MEKITKSSDRVLIDPNEPLILPDGTALVGRVEWFLYALCCLDYQNLPTPMSRIEEFANALITGEVPNIEPQSRAEQFFLAILNGNVSDLPQPQSRSEVLLDKLARGEFDLSDVEPIQSSYELLLAYLIKNGGIGNIDYVLYEFSEAMKTMYNTVEKPFKSLELGGNTLVNCVLEDTENDDYTSFDKDYSGTSFTINGTSEGAIKSATLKGQTLVNLLDRNNMITEAVEYTFNNGVYTIVSNRDWGKMKFNPILASNKKYILFISSSYKDCMIYYRVASGVATPIGHAVNAPIIFTTPSEQIANISIEFPTAVANETVSYPMLLEYQDGMENWDIPYFEGMASCKMPTLKSIGKNLISMNNFRSYYNAEILFCNTNSITFNAPNDWAGVFVNLSLKPNTEYHISYECQNDNTIKTIIRYLNDDETLTGETYGGENNFSFMTKGNGKVRVSIESNTIQDNIVLKNIQLEEGTVATSYEPHKTNILHTTEEVVLRSLPNGVKDTLNVETGELTQRIGEITFDGTNKQWEVLTYPPQKAGTHYQFKHQLGEGVIGGGLWTNAQSILSNTLPSANESLHWGGNGNYGIGGDGNSIMLTWKKDTCPFNDITTLNEWLKKNPLTVQYTLATPVVKTVDLNVVDQNNTKIDKMHVFNEVTHVNASSDELIPMVNISKSVSYPTIIKPNTKYTVDLKRNDKPLTVNLGGTEVTFASGETRKVITTPSTLTNDKLSCYGIGAKCNKIMLIEGEVEGNVDYFTGMQSVVMQNQMPILSTVGKNLFDINSNPSYVTDGTTYNVNNNTLTILSDGTVGYPRVNFKLDKSLFLGRTIYCSYGDVEYTASNWIIQFVYKNADGVLQYKPFKTTKEVNFPNEINGDLTLGIYPINSGTTGVTHSLTIKNIQLEYGTQTTAYEPYKTSILSYDEEVVLREIGDVKDTLNLNTGEYVQRIGSITADELEASDYYKADLELENTIQFGMLTRGREKLRAKTSAKSVCNIIPVMLGNDDVFHARVDGGTPYGSFTIWMDKTKLETEDVFGLIKWLRDNNAIIQYELAEPIVTTIDLSVVDQDGNTIPKVKSYNGTTHLEVKIPKQSLLPNISAEVATDNSKDISSLTVKHQEISEAQSAIQNNIQSQTDEIDTAMMATTEIFESILE